MKESYRKGIANHPDPESCRRCGRKAGREALTGAQAGREIELRNHRIQEADAVDGSGRRKTNKRYRKFEGHPAQSVDPEHVWNFYAREPGDPVNV